MHKVIISDGDRPLMQALYAHLRKTRRRSTPKSQDLSGRAQSAVVDLRRALVTPPRLRSPEVLTVLRELVDGLLGPGARSEDEVARLTVALYLGHELISEMEGRT